MVKRATDVDEYVGRRTRQRRLELGLSQGRQLAKALGITFQQIQKYETAKNRISGCKLKVLADYFKISVGSFFNENEESFNFKSVGSHISVIKNLIQLEKNDPALVSKINTLISHLTKKENSDA